jgi:hypothetical protein
MDSEINKSNDLTLEVMLEGLLDIVFFQQN